MLSAGLVANSNALELTSFEYGALMKLSSIPIEKDETGYNGLWNCPITDKVIRHSSKLSVVNLVSKSFAVENGGNAWPYATINSFQEDMSNLLVADKQAIEQRQDNPPVLWLPEVNKCGYLYQWDYVVKKYQLAYPLEQVFAYEKLISQCDKSSGN